jgi:hypothetical protein
MMLVRTKYSKPGSAVRTTSDQDSDLNLAASNFSSLGDSEVLESDVTRMRNRTLIALLLSLSGLLLARCPPRESIAKINQDRGSLAAKKSRSRDG